ncbi:MAG: hypothetical protein PUC98_04625 [Clostridiales bacterium]|nr:hypothetical protein [Clostridiales bacterium]MDO5141025.1 hypothetical protein [Eubacteriales bacterium]
MRNGVFRKTLHGIEYFAAMSLMIMCIIGIRLSYFAPGVFSDIFHTIGG